MMDISGKAIVERMCKLGEIKEYVLYCGIPSSTISNWKTRDNSPKVSDIVKIAEYKKVSLEWLITGQEKKEEGLSADERNMLEAYRLLDEKDRQELKAIAELKLSLNMSRLGEGAEEKLSV